MKALINSCRQSCKLHGSAVCCCSTSSLCSRASSSFFFVGLYPHLVVFICTYMISSLYTMYMTRFHLFLSFSRLTTPQSTACSFNSIHHCVVNCLLRLHVFAFIKINDEMCTGCQRNMCRIRMNTIKRWLHKIDTVNNKNDIHFSRQSSKREMK